MILIKDVKYGGGRLAGEQLILEAIAETMRKYDMHGDVNLYQYISQQRF